MKEIGGIQSIPGFLFGSFPLGKSKLFSRRHNGIRRHDRGVNAAVDVGHGPARGLLLPQIAPEGRAVKHT